jgi:hypothetical protein
MTSHTITLIPNIALAISVVIGLIFGIFQVKTAARDRQERLTLEALRNFNTREFSELMNYVTSHDIPPTHEEWQKLPAHEDYGYSVCAGNGIAWYSCGRTAHS